MSSPYTEACKRRGACHLVMITDSGGVEHGMGKGLLYLVCQQLSQA